MATSLLKRVRVEDGSKFIGVVFLYMGIALLITAAVATGFGFLWASLFPAVNYQDIAATVSDESCMVYFWVMIASGVLELACVIWIVFGVLRRKSKLLLIPYIIYTVVNGVFISSFTIFIPPYEIGIVFGITCLAFGGMALIALVSKSRLHWLAIIGIGLLIGGLLMSGFNLILMFVFPAVYTSMYWIVSFVILLAIMLITIWDIRRVKTIAESGAATEQEALYCAFTLYVDFIVIFIRLLLMLASARK